MVFEGLSGPGLRDQPSVVTNNNAKNRAGVAGRLELIIVAMSLKLISVDDSRTG